jgi:hypothetical protein
VVDDSGLVDSSGNLLRTLTLKRGRLIFGYLGVGRFTPLIPGRQRPRPNRGGRRGRPPGSGKRSRVMASSSGAGREPTKPALENEVGFLSPEANRLSDISSNNGSSQNISIMSY